MTLQVETFKGSAYWASYLINGDASGLEPREIELCDAWRARIAPFYIVSCDDESYFSWSYGLHTGGDCRGGDLLDYTGHAPSESVQ